MVDNEVVMWSKCLFAVYSHFSICSTILQSRIADERRPKDSYVRNLQRPESEGVISYTTASNIIHYNVTLRDARPCEDQRNDLEVFEATLDRG